MSSIYLVGFMGCGKSTVGPLVAERLGLPFIDVDELIEQNRQRTIAEIFAAEGEAGFRAVERTVVSAVAGGPAAVVATGGGFFAVDENRRLIAEKGGLTVFLHPPWTVLAARIGADHGGRPLWNSLEGARDLYRARLEAYRLADITVDVTGDESPRSVADRIVCATLELACGT